MLDLKKWTSKVSKMLLNIQHSAYAMCLSTSLGNAKAVASGSDMDNYMTEGAYFIANASVVATLSNYPPTNAGGRLEVFNVVNMPTTAASSARRLYQRIYINGTACPVYYRHWNGTSWSAWRLVSTTLGGG